MPAPTQYPSIESLHTYLTVAELGNMTRAAKKLGVSQSALSRRLSQLEELLGLQLFLREGRSIQLSDIGDRFRSEALSMVAAAERALAMARALQEEPRGCVRIGVTVSIGSFVIPHFLQFFCHAFPTIQISIEEGVSTEVEDRVIRGDIHIGLIARQPRYEELFTQKLWREPHHLVAPQGLFATKASKGAVTLRDLIGKPLAVPLVPSAKPALIDGLRKYGSEALFVANTDNLETLRHIVENGLASAVLPQVAAHNLDWKAQVIPIQDLHFERQVFLIHRAAHRTSPAPQLVRKELIAWIQENLGTFHHQKPRLQSLP